MLKRCADDTYGNFLIAAVAVCLSICLHTSVLANDRLPYLQVHDGVTRFIVADRPFLILGGELGNSSASDMRYMENIWPRLKALHLNTLLAPVYWELLEPVEGEYDFRLLQELIDRARKEDIKLVLLWFGSWKNSMSSYAPPWVKRDQQRFPRATGADGTGQEILTPFSDDNLAADRRVFVELMGFLKRYDGGKNTVLMIQVENEIGMLPNARDFYPLATEKYQQQVPANLMDYLQTHKETLGPEIYSAWERQNFPVSGSWETVFGTGLHTQEIFMAWFFGRYVNTLADAGKAVYPLPMYVNAALNRPGVLPGDYPSAGPLPHVMDIWRAATPAIDLYSPDFYNPRFQHWNDLYTRNGAALFIPEIRFTADVATKALYAFGHYNCIGFAPFSIESEDAPEVHPLAESYRLLSQMTPLIAHAQGTENIGGVLLTKEIPETTLEFGAYTFTVKHDYTLGWSPAAGDETWPEAAAIIVVQGENEFYVAGTGVVLTFEAKGKNRAGIEQIFEGVFESGVFRTGRSLNGDQSHQGRHLRIPVGEYSIQQLRLYQYQ